MIDNLSQLASGETYQTVKNPQTVKTMEKYLDISVKKALFTIPTNWNRKEHIG